MKNPRWWGLGSPAAATATAGGRRGVGWFGLATSPQLVAAGRSRKRSKEERSNGHTLHTARFRKLKETSYIYIYRPYRKKNKSHDRTEQVAIPSRIQHNKTKQNKAFV